MPELPDPMTAPECDLRDFAYMPLDVARLLDSDLFALATGDEFKSAIALWCKAWLQVPAGSLPDDDRVLAHLSGAGSKWKKVKSMALKGFVKCQDGRLYHSTVSEKANDAWAKKEAFRDRSKKANAKRWGASKDSNKDSNKDATGIAQGLLNRPKGEGEGEGYSVSYKEETDVAVVLPFCSPDPDKQFWDGAKSYLAGKSSMIGKWIRDHGREATAKAITEAQINRAVDPVPYIIAALRKAGRGDDAWEFTGPC